MKFNRNLFQEKFYGKTIIVADRDFVEQGADELLSQAAESSVAFLVVGDPFGATTHTDLILRAKEKNIKVQIVHNASIMNAVVSILES
jgi:diphthine methyl ester synthase